MVDLLETPPLARIYALTRREWAVLTGGDLLLAASNYRETVAIGGVVG